MNALPMDVLNAILKTLNFHSLVQVRQTCRRLRQAVENVYDNDYSVVHSIILREESELDDFETKFRRGNACLFGMSLTPEHERADAAPDMYALALRHPEVPICSIRFHPSMLLPRPDFDFDTLFARNHGPLLYEDLFDPIPFHPLKGVREIHMRNCTLQCTLAFLISHTTCTSYDFSCVEFEPDPETGMNANQSVILSDRRPDGTFRTIQYAHMSQDLCYSTTCEHAKLTLANVTDDLLKYHFPALTRLTLIGGHVRLYKPHPSIVRITLNHCNVYSVSLPNLQKLESIGLRPGDMHLFHSLSVKDVSMKSRRGALIYKQPDNLLSGLPTQLLYKVVETLNFRERSAVACQNKDLRLFMQFLRPGSERGCDKQVNVDQLDTFLQNPSLPTHYGSRFAYHVDVDKYVTAETLDKLIRRRVPIRSMIVTPDSPRLYVGSLHKLAMVGMRYTTYETWGSPSRVVLKNCSINTRHLNLLLDHIPETMHYLTLRQCTLIEADSLDSCYIYHCHMEGNDMDSLSVTLDARSYCVTPLTTILSHPDRSVRSMRCSRLYTLPNFISLQYLELTDCQDLVLTRTVPSVTVLTIHRSALYPMSHLPSLTRISIYEWTQPLRPLYLPLHKLQWVLIQQNPDSLPVLLNGNPVHHFQFRSKAGSGRSRRRRV